MVSAKPDRFLKSNLTAKEELEYYKLIADIQSVT